MYLELIISDKVKAIIEKTCQFLLENGSEHEEYLLKSKSVNDENFGFLFQESPYHAYYKTYLEWLKSPDSQNKKFDFYEIIHKKQQKAPLMRLDAEIPPKQIENFNANNQNNNAMSFNIGQMPIQNNNSNFNIANNKNPQMFNNANNVPPNFNNNFPPIQSAPTNNVGNPIKKKNRWSDSAVNQTEIPNQNQNNNNLLNRPMNYYPQQMMPNMNMNVGGYNTNYHPQMVNNQMIPNIMNQMNVNMNVLKK